MGFLCKNKRRVRELLMAELNELRHEVLQVRDEVRGVQVDLEGLCVDFKERCLELAHLVTEMHDAREAREREPLRCQLDYSLDCLLQPNSKPFASPMRAAPQYVLEAEARVPCTSVKTQCEVSCAAMQRQLVLLQKQVDDLTESSKLQQCHQQGIALEIRTLKDETTHRLDKFEPQLDSCTSRVAKLVCHESQAHVSSALGTSLTSTSSLVLASDFKRACSMV